jgi:hypothetical protein
MERGGKAVDSWVAIGWAAVNALLLGALGRLCHRCFPHDTAAQVVMHTLLVYWVAVVLACFVLGGLHLICGASVAGAGVVLAALALGALRGTAGRGWRLGLRGVGCGDRPKAELQPPSSRLGRGLVALGWLMVFSYWTARVLFEGLPGFPWDFDSLMYHIPLIDHWLQAGSLYVPDCPEWYNASTNELLGLWIVAPFSGDFLVALNNVPGCLLLALAALELARNLGIRSPLDHLLALAVTATQVFCKQLIDNENDVAAAALFLACAAYGLRYLRDRRVTNLAWAAACFGLLAGIKYYAVGYAVVAWTGLSLCAWLQGGRRDALRVLLAGAVGGLLLAGYWYGRNLWLTGTPFFPLGLSPETDVLPQFYPNPWHSTFLGSGRPEVVPLGLRAVWKMAGPCHLLALLALPLVLGWLAGTGLLQRDFPERSSRWLLAFLTAGAAAVLLVTPWAIETEPGTLDQLRWGYIPVRFGQCFLGLAVLALGVLLSDLMRGLHRACAAAASGPLARRSPAGRRAASDCGLAAWRRFRRIANLGFRWFPLLPAGLVAALLAWQGVRVLQDPFFANRSNPRDIALLTLDLVLVGLLVWVPNWHGMPAVSRRAAAVAVLVAAAGLAWSVAALAQKWHDGFARHYDALFSTRVFTDLAQRDPAATRICVLEYRYYPFFGSRRQYSVCRPIKAFSYPWLLEFLRERQANAIACTLDDPFTLGRYRGASVWLREHPEIFVPSRADGQFVWADVRCGQLARATQP